MNARPMRNRFAGTCDRCRQHVGVGDGLAERVAGRWVVNHVACPAPQEPRGLPGRAALARAGFDADAATFGGRDDDEGDRG